VDGSFDGSETRSDRSHEKTSFRGRSEVMDGE
jgi:hypothetical protein